MLKSLLALLCVLTLVAALDGQSGSATAADAGWQALRANDPDRAAKIFHEGLTRNPRDPMLHFGAGVAAQRLGRYLDAVEFLKQAISFDPQLIDAVIALAETEYQREELAAAIRALERALAQTPANQALAARLDAWRKEAARHRTRQQWSNAQFSVMFEGPADEALATRAMAVLDEAYWRIGRAIGAYPPGPTPVTLYSEEPFRDSTRSPAWAAGAFDGRIRVPVSGATRDLQQFDLVLTHELTHAIVHAIANHGVPAWLHEGIACYFEPRSAELAARFVRSKGTVLPLARLQEGFARLNQSQAALAYAESVVAADVLMKRLGPRLAILLQHLEKGHTFDQALVNIGLPPAEFHSAFLARLK